MRNCLSLRSGLGLATLLLTLSSCGPGVFSVAPPPSEIHIAAAANLAAMFDQLAAAAQKSTRARLIPSFGSTAQLTKQIEAGAPFDLFLAADTEHPIQLASSGLADTPREYARGRLVLWAPKRNDIHVLTDLVRPDVKVIALANPDLAPYGHAAVEALTNAKLWDQVKAKVVYGQNISAALTFADTGNADVAITAYSLVAAHHPNTPLIPADLHRPIVQSLCILKRTNQLPEVQKVVDFLLGPQGRAVFEKNGYPVP
jgi:molybdate transport system substrate-binding protein